MCLEGDARPFAVHVILSLFPYFLLFFPYLLLTWCMYPSLRFFRWQLVWIVGQLLYTVPAMLFSHI
jgi:hypothetical protein